MGDYTAGTSGEVILHSGYRGFLGLDFPVTTLLQALHTKPPDSLVSGSVNGSPFVTSWIPWSVDLLKVHRL